MPPSAPPSAPPSPSPPPIPPPRPPPPSPSSPNYCTPVYYMLDSSQSCPGGYHLTESECNAYRTALGAARGQTVGGSTGRNWAVHPPGCWDYINGAYVYFNTHATGSIYNNMKLICKYPRGSRQSATWVLACQGVVCVIETKAMAAVYLRPHSPPLVCGGHRTRERSTQSGPFANALNTNMKNVWFGALGRGMYQGRVAVGCGVGWGELTGRERRAGGKASWGWAAEGAATIYMERDAV